MQYLPDTLDLLNDDTAASTLSIPLQQTARYARDHGDETLR